MRARLDQVTQDILDEAVLKVMMGARREGQRYDSHADGTRHRHGASSRTRAGLHEVAGRAPLRFTIIPRGQSGGHVALPG